MDQYTTRNTTITFTLRTARRGTAARFVLTFIFRFGGETRPLQKCEVSWTDLTADVILENGCRAKLSKQRLKSNWTKLKKKDLGLFCS